MNSILYIIICLVSVGCAATVVKYDWCFGFCGSAVIDKEETPQHVTDAVKEVTK